MGKNVAILGASGYTGAELVRLIAGHPDINIVGLSAERKAGQQMGDVFPHLRHMDLPQLVKIDELSFENVDLVFCALPHATSQAVIRALRLRYELLQLLLKLARDRARLLHELRLLLLDHLREERGVRYGVSRDGRHAAQR